MYRFYFIFVVILCLSQVCFADTQKKDFVYKNKSTRDPFIALVTQDGRILPGARETSESTDIDLEGIIWDPNGKSLAIINGRPVKEKQRIQDVQILKIRKDSVLMQKEGKVIVINLKKGGGKDDN